MSDLFGQAATIKALSLWQPWASLMAVGVKLHETRHWATSYRGPLAIHAAKTLDKAGAPHDLCVAALGEGWETSVPLGAIVAIGQLKRCGDAERVQSQTHADREAGNFARGRFAWAIDAVRPLRAPILTPGRQGLFNWALPDDIEARLGAPLNHAECARLIGWA